MRVVVLFACVYALSSADTGTVGSVAPQLEGSLRISNTEIGILAAVAALAAAAGTIPAGVLTDRVNRVGLLSGSIVLWSAAQLASAFSTSFTMLVLTRLALGAVNATSGPTIASLTGDYFPARERARMLGLILTGELIGSGIGLVVSGDLASDLSWRYGFGWLTIPGLALAWALWRLLVEPDRGGQSRLEPGAQDFVSQEEAARERRRGHRRSSSPGAATASRRGEGAASHRDEADGQPVDQEQEVVRDLARQQHLQPRARLVLKEDPTRMPLGRAIRYVLAIPTNVVLIVASALAYLFFAGVQTFAVLLVRGRFGLSEGSATALLVLIGVGALAGVVLSGYFADRWLARGRLNARVTVGAIAYIAAAVLFIPGLLSPLLIVSLPLFIIGAGGLAAPDPVLNAARLDIMHPHLWGRAEGVRTVLYMLAFAVAPLLFGLISDNLGGRDASAAAAGGGVVTHANGNALAYTFLIMIVPVAIAGASLLWARRTYPRDVATAVASTDATLGRDDA